MAKNRDRRKKAVSLSAGGETAEKAGPRTGREKRSPAAGTGAGGAGGGRVARLLSSPARAALVVFVVSIALYANTLGHDFVWDDRELIVDNPAVRTLDGETVQKIFLTDFWRTVQRGGGYYRPLVTLSYHVHYKIFKGKPWGFHAVNVMWNALVCALVFLFVRLLFANSLLALVVALIFAVHPIHTENVAWVSGRTDLLAALWMMASLVCYVLAKRRSVWYLFASLVAFMLALLAKESAACLPLIILLLEFGPFGHLFEKGRAPAKRSIVYPILFFAMFGLYLLIRRGVIGTTMSTYDGYAPGGLGLIGLPLSILAGYAFKLVYPLHLNGEYDAPVPESFADAHVLGGLLVLAVVVYGVVRYKHRPEVVLGAGIFLLGLAPVTNIIPIGEISAERFLYFPSLGFALVLGSIFSPALIAKYRLLRQIAGRESSDRHGDPGGRAKHTGSLAGALTLVLVAVLVTFAARTVARNPDWRTEEVLFAKTAEGAPQSARALLGVGNVHRDKGEIPAAIAAYKRALELKPDYADALSNLAGLYVQQGRLSEAVPLVERALELAPNNLQLLGNVGSLYFEQKRYDDAAAMFEKVIAIDPEQLTPRFNLGMIRLQKGDYAAARRHFEKVAGQTPAYDVAYYFLAVIEQRSGNVERAREIARHFLSIYKRNDSYRTQAQAIVDGR